MAVSGEARAAMALQRRYRGHKARREGRGLVLSRVGWMQVTRSVQAEEMVKEGNESLLSRVMFHSKNIGKGAMRVQSGAANLLHVESWLESVDSRHRHGAYLRSYHEAWKGTETGDSFFHWLDYGAGKDLSLGAHPRAEMESMCVRYIHSTEGRRPYMVDMSCHAPTRTVQLCYSATGQPVHTLDEEGKWIFVIGTDDQIYVGKKVRGKFHHSSFLAGGATKAAGKLKVAHGLLCMMEPHSGHYKPKVAELRRLKKRMESVGADLSKMQWVKPKKWAGEWPFD